MIISEGVHLPVDPDGAGAPKPVRATMVHHYVVGRLLLARSYRARAAAEEPSTRAGHALREPLGLRFGPLQHHARQHAQGPAAAARPLLRSAGVVARLAILLAASVEIETALAVAAEA